MNILNQIPHLILFFEIAYLIGIVLLAGKIIMDTKTTSKTLAYLLLIIFLPLAGIIIYFVFGVNYRKNKFYNFKFERNEEIYRRVQDFITAYHNKVLARLPDHYSQFRNTINFLFSGSHSPLTQGNKIELLINGEEKFPKVFDIIRQAKHHIHLEYYIYENDDIGNQLANLLIEKSGQGVIVRLLYDGFGSGKIGKRLLTKLREGGVQVTPVNKIRFRLLANRVNYRDHRKIIIVDGEHVFSGGINISDRYINAGSGDYWRDTHLYLNGNAAAQFQYLFLTGWFFSTRQKIPNIREYFSFDENGTDGSYVQVVGSGPDVKPFIMLSTTSSIYEARKRIYITTPYFIPVESVLNAIKTQSQAGIDVRILVPEKGDSALVNIAAYSFYEELLRNGVRVYLYKKGFIHAKTIIVDDVFSSVGTANMDVRSQELNFEVNTHIYDREINRKLCNIFMVDLNDSTEIVYDEWRERPKIKVFFEHLARLFSPLM